MKKESDKEKQTHKIVGALMRSDEAVEKFIAAGKDLTIDFSECTFISVPGLEWLESMLLKASSGKVRVIFMGMHPSLYKVFKVARIESILNACGSPASYANTPVC